MDQDQMGCGITAATQAATTIWSRGNTVATKLTTGSYNDIWMKSGCGTQTNNAKGSTAEGQLTPKEQKLPPPSARGVAPKPWVAR
jgi:hypothetical protein